MSLTREGLAKNLIFDDSFQQVPGLIDSDSTLQNKEGSKPKVNTDIVKIITAPLTALKRYVVTKLLEHDHKWA